MIGLFCGREGYESYKVCPHARALIFYYLLEPRAKEVLVFAVIPRRGGALLVITGGKVRLDCLSSYRVNP